MSIFDEKNQSFRTLDLLALVGLVGTVGTIFGAIIAQSFHDSRPTRAQITAEAVARQIQTRHKQGSSLPSGSRSPASTNSVAFVEGKMGKDPWGRPFRYRVSRSDGATNGKARVYVWSDGPNGKSDFDEGNQRFAGDDVGHVEEFALEGEPIEISAGSSFGPASSKK